MAVTIRPAVRENTPLIIGLAGPSKSGKTYSAHRLARGLAGPDGLVVMLNAEGKRGHQYAGAPFRYHACDIDAPYSYARYSEHLDAIAELKPACVIIDSISHAHDGPGGMIEEHDTEVERRSKGDDKKAERVTWAAWIKPKAEEGKFIYRMLAMDCPIILCFRAKEKIKIVPGKAPIDLGYQPIASERISFETIFSLMLPPRSKGVPDLNLSDMREPFDSMIYEGQAIDEDLGARLGQWAAGVVERITEEQQKVIKAECARVGLTLEQLCAKAHVATVGDIEAGDYEPALAWVRRHTPRPPVDEAVALRKIDAAKTRDEAADILDSFRGMPFHARISEAYQQRWGA